MPQFFLHMQSTSANAHKLLFVTALILVASLLSSCGPATEGERPATRVADARIMDEQGPLSPVLSHIPDAAMVDDRVNIALLLPLSGEGGDMGRALMDAAMMAFFESYDPRLDLTPYDTRGSKEGALQAAMTALNAGANVIIGPLFSDNVTAIRDMTSNAGVPVISFSNNVNVAGDGVYLMGFNPADEVRRIVSYATSQGMERFAILVPDTDYGDMVFDSFTDAIDATGASITAIEVYPRTPQEMFTPVRRLANYPARRNEYLAEENFLKGLDDDFGDELLENIKHMETIGDVNFDAVIVPEGGQLLRSLAPLLPFFEVDPNTVKFLGTGLWDDPSLVLEPPLQGGWFPSADVASSATFMARFKATYGYDAPRLSTIAYDAMSLVLHLARNPVREERFTPATFKQAQGFKGVDGPFRIKENGVVERKLAIIEIGKKTLATIEKAEAGFSR